MLACTIAESARACKNRAAAGSDRAIRQEDASWKADRTLKVGLARSIVRVSRGEGYNERPPDPSQRHHYLPIE